MNLLDKFRPKKPQNEEVDEVQTPSNGDSVQKMSDEINELRRRVSSLTIELQNLYDMLTRKSNVTGENVLSATGKRAKAWIIGSPAERFK